MKLNSLALCAGLVLLFSAMPLPAADAPGPATELKDLITQVQTKLKEGKKSETDLAPDLKAFDDLLAKHKDEKTDEVAQILYMKAMLYLQVLEDNTNAVATIEQLKKDFPNTGPGKNADKMLESIKQQEEAKKVSRALVQGSKFPEFEEKDVTGKPLSLAGYKDKVVLIDFWATWCRPCVMELPNVLETYKKHHADGFDIIGVSLDSDEQKLTSFTKSKEMPWRQFFDGKGWSNKLAVKYGVQSIPMTYLLDGQGTIIGIGLRGEELEQAVSKALAKK